MWERCQTSVPIGNKVGTRRPLYAYSSGNGHELKKNNPWIPEGHGFRGSSIHKFGKASKPLDRSGPNLTHVCRFIWEWTSAKKLTCRAPRGIWKGLAGSHIQKMWETCQTAGQIGTKFGTRMLLIWEWT